MSDVIE